jgi:hypothetical protein
MVTYDDLFVEGFTKAAVEMGVAVEHVPVLLEYAWLLDNLQKDAAFAEGFESTMEKYGMDKEAQHFWKNFLGGTAAGTLAGTAINPGLGSLIGAIGGGIAGAGRGVYKNWSEMRNPLKNYNKYNAKRLESLRRHGVPEEHMPHEVWGKKEPEKSHYAGTRVLPPSGWRTRYSRPPGTY